MNRHNQQIEAPKSNPNTSTRHNRALGVLGAALAGIALTAGVVSKPNRAAAADRQAARVQLYNGHFTRDGKPFIPIFAWEQCDVQANQAAGINTIMGNGPGCTPEDIAQATLANDMEYMGRYSDRSQQPVLPNQLGFYLPDEPDGYGVKPSDPSLQVEKPTSLPIEENFTIHVVTDQGTPDGAKYKAYLKNVDMVGADLYPIAHCYPWTRGKEGDTGSVYDLQKGLNGVAGPEKVTYQWIEVNDLEGQCGQGVVTPETIKTEALLVMAAYGKGVGEFTDGWPKGVLQLYSVSPENQQAMQEVNAEIQDMAAVFNSKPLYNVRSAHDDPIKIGAWEYAGKTWILAVNSTKNPVHWDRKFKNLIGNNVQVRYEDRSLAAQKGQLEDEFDGYARHWYVADTPKTHNVKPAKKAGLLKRHR